MLRVQRDHDARKLRPLALVNRQNIRQRQLVQVSEVVFDGSTLESDDHLLLNAVDLLHDAQVAVRPRPVVARPAPVARRPDSPPG
jgi:hypothetical protein